MKIKLLRLLPIIMISACASVRTISVNREVTALPPDCPIKVVSVRPPPAEAEEIALLQMSGATQSLGKYMPKLKAQACAVGGDMIFIPGLTVDAWAGSAAVTALVPVFRTK